MKKEHFGINDILNEKIKREKYKDLKKDNKTIAQFQLNHCRYCKNKKSSLCEIRKNIDDQYSCMYEENIYERRNIK